MREKKRQQKTTIGAIHLCNANWNHANVMALINYKQKQKIALKWIIDPKANMVGNKQMEQDCKRLTRNNGGCHGAN